MTNDSPTIATGAAMHAYYCDEIKIDGSDIDNASGAVSSPSVFAFLRHGRVFSSAKQTMRTGMQAADACCDHERGFLAV